MLKNITHINIPENPLGKNTSMIFIHMRNGDCWMGVFDEPSVVLSNRIGEVLEHWQKNTKSGKKGFNNAHSSTSYPRWVCEGK